MHNIRNKCSLPSVIIADNHFIFRQGVIDILKKQNRHAKIFETGNGFDVINVLEKSHFDIVLIGERLGVLNGIETTALVKQKFPNTKIICISSFVNPYYILDMHSRGANGFLLKDANNDELLMVIRKVMEGRDHFPVHLIKKFISIENGIIQHSISKKKHIQERIREIIYLISAGLSSKEIAKIIDVSFKTVENDRQRLHKLMDSNKVTCIMRYGILTGIIEDEELEKKFYKYFKSIK